MSTTRPPAYDERFATPIDASRRGAHRARPKPVSAGLPVLAGIAVVLVVIGGVYTVLGGNHKDDKGAAVAAAPSASVSASATPSAGATGAGASASATTPAGSTGSSATATGSAGSTGTVNRAVALKILNSVAVQGLAKKVQARIEPDGWTVAGTSNSIQRNLVTTKVYYGSSSLKATAKAMVHDLGYGAVDLNAAVAPKGLVVVLGQDAEQG